VNLNGVGVLTGFTLKEFFHRKILHVLFLLFLLFCSTIPLWKHFAPETEMEFLADMGVGLAGIFLLLMTLIIAGDLVPRDLESRRLLFFSLHPIDKGEYLLGRALGTFVFLFISFTLFISMLKIFFIFQKWQISVTPVFFLLFKYLILAALLFCLSPHVERFTSIFLGLCFYFLSNSIATLTFLAGESGKPFFALWVKAISFLLPHLEIFDAAGGFSSSKFSFLIYGTKTLAYALWFISVYLFLACLGLRKRTL